MTRTDAPNSPRCVSPEHPSLFDRIGALTAAGAAARSAGDEVIAERSYREAMVLAFGLVQAPPESLPAKPNQDRHALVRQAASLALQCGESGRARQLVMEAIHSAGADNGGDWNDLLEYSQWPDAWLIASVRRDPPDMEALNTLVDRTWKRLFARCRVLTLDHDKANDLAQQAWVRVLQARRTLKPGGNPLAYLTTVATNLWRDAHRAKRRAGPLAEHRITSLDESQPSQTGHAIVLADIIPDAVAAHAREHSLLMQEVDHALDQLPPLWREVVVARFVAGESCASIGARHGRTEQTVSGWLRAAIAELQERLIDPRPDGHTL